MLDYLNKDEKYLNNFLDYVTEEVEVGKSVLTPKTLATLIQSPVFEESFLIHIKRIATQRLKMLDGLIGLCPMLGLLGTVYGMIEVFEVLAVLGTGNPRAMSTGVAKATIPTMAGMTIALSGLFFKFDLANRVERYQEEARIYLKEKLAI